MTIGGSLPLWSAESRRGGITARLRSSRLLHVRAVR